MVRLLNPPSSGNNPVSAAPSTPGIVSTRRSTLSSRRGSRRVCVTTTPRGSKPGFTERRATSVRMKRDAPIKSTIAVLISTIASRERTLPPPPFMPLLRSARETWSAGISPNTRPVTAAANTVNARTRQSSATFAPFSPNRGMSTACVASSTRMPAAPSASPQTAPAAASSPLSVRNCRTILPREAPTATRIATSRFLPSARINKRLATLAQAISSTKPTAAASVNRDARTSFTR